MLGQSRILLIANTSRMIRYNISRPVSVSQGFFAENGDRSRLREIIPFTVETSSIEIELLKKKKLKKRNCRWLSWDLFLPQAISYSAREIMTLKIM